MLMLVLAAWLLGFAVVTIALVITLFLPPDDEEDR